MLQLPRFIWGKKSVAGGPCAEIFLTLWSQSTFLNRSVELDIILVTETNASAGNVLILMKSLEKVFYVENGVNMRETTGKNNKEK